jgi:hypothetical protein
MQIQENKFSPSTIKGLQSNNTSHLNLPAVTIDSRNNGNGSSTQGDTIDVDKERLEFSKLLGMLSTKLKIENGINKENQNISQPNY